MDRDGPGALIDDQVAVVEGRRRCGVAPAQNRPHPGFELGERVRLHDEVVGAEVQKADTVALGGPAGADDDGYSAPAPDLGEDLRGPATLVQVEDDQIGGVAEGSVEAGHDAGGLNHVVAEAAQVVLQGAATVGVVLRHEDRARRGAWREHHRWVDATETFGVHVLVQPVGAGRHVEWHGHAPPDPPWRSGVRQCSCAVDLARGREPRVMWHPPSSVPVPQWRCGSSPSIVGTLRVRLHRSFGPEMLPPWCRGSGVGRAEAVADAADGGDPPWRVRIGLNLQADPADVLGHRRSALPLLG